MAETWSKRARLLTYSLELHSNVAGSGRMPHRVEQGISHLLDPGGQPLPAQ